MVLYPLILRTTQKQGVINIFILYFMGLERPRYLTFRSSIVHALLMLLKCIHCSFKKDLLTTYCALSPVLVSKYPGERHDQFNKPFLA